MHSLVSAVLRQNIFIFIVEIPVPFVPFVNFNGGNRTVFDGEVGGGMSF